MTLLLDTHVLLWWLFDDDRLTPAMRAAIADPRTSVAVSAASAWEMAIKATRGKLTIPEDLAEEIARQGFEQARTGLKRRSPRCHQQQDHDSLEDSEQSATNARPCYLRGQGTFADRKPDAEPYGEGGKAHGQATDDQEGA